MPELAKAYVQIVPTMKGVKNTLTNLMDDAGGAAGKKAGGKMSSAIISMLTGGDIKSSVKTVGGTLAKGFGNVIKTTGKLAFAGIAAGAAAAATGIGAIGKQAVAAYADFEQLKGGIETLFGTGGMGLSQYAASQGKAAADVEEEYYSLKHAQDLMMENASKAFKTAGMSANEYMETAIQSGAAMIASLDGDTSKAAELMDLSITDMADNVNKMGTTMEAVQNAYRGFSRGNFTMLDNLALGFSGTKEGMQALLKQAEEISDVKYDINSYSDIVQAIHVVQMEMGITGTTAKEAAGTISGSIGSMKAAWQNLLTGLASGNSNVAGLASNLAGSVKTVAGNLLPVIRTVLRNIMPVVAEIVPMIATELPPLLSDILPGLTAAAVDLAVGLGIALAENAPQIIQTLCDALVQNAPALATGAVQLVVSLATGLAQALPQIFMAGAQILGALLDAIAEGIPELLSAGANLVRGLWEGISGAAGWLWDKITGWLASIWDGIKEFFGVASPSKEMAWMGEMLSAGLADGITSSADEAVAAATRMSADVLGAMNPDAGLDLSATGAAAVEIRHTGTVRVEGVNDRGELVAVTELIYDQLVARLQREVRYA